MIDGSDPAVTPIELEQITDNVNPVRILGLAAGQSLQVSLIQAVPV